MKRHALMFFLLSGLVLPVRARDGAAISSERGTQLYKGGKYAEAAQAFEEALVNDPTRAQRKYIYLYMGKSYESAGRLDKAIAAYESAVDFDRGNWRRHRDLAGLYAQSELYLKAVASYKEALRLNESEPSLYLAYGHVWRKLGLYSYAEDWLKRALAAGKELPTVRQELSYVYEGQGRFAEAAAASTAAEDDPKRIVYLAVLAGDRVLSDEGLDRMREKSASPETIQAYENLVQLGLSPTNQILDGKIGGSNLRELLQKP